jgi:hypothetical protein
MRLGRKHRATSVSPPLDKNMQAAVIRFAAEFLESDAFKHGSSKGGEREHPVREFLRQRLPAAFRVDCGEVIDLYGNTSPQVDLLVSDSQRNFPLVEGSSVILPVEALLVAVEVKSLLNQAETRNILRAAERFKALKPFKQRVVERRQKGRPAGDGSRIFYAVFAYKSDLSTENWAEKEHCRFSKVSEEIGIPLHVVDRVYVANRGLLDIGREKGFEEQGKSGAALLQQ